MECRFVNFASSDSDNLTGTILDTFVEAGILGGDSKSYVSGSSGQFYSKRKERGKPKDLGSLILVRPQEIIPLDIEIPVGLCL